MCLLVVQNRQKKVCYTITPFNLVFNEDLMLGRQFVRFVTLSWRQNVHLNLISTHSLYMFNKNIIY